jgi:hypothetical protein
MGRMSENLPPLSAWQTESLRLTAFPSPSAQVDNQEWWTKLVGEPPESKNLQPRERTQTETGPYGAAKLALTVQPNRIDWNYAKEPTEGVVLSDRTLGSFPETADSFIEWMNRWFSFEDAPSLVRLAFGAVLLQPQADLEGAYGLLGRYLPFLELKGDVSDLVYQINRRRNSSLDIPGLKINRLSRWSASAFTTFTLSSLSSSPEVSEPAYSCRLVLDINTAPDFTDEFEPGALPNLLKELVEAGNEIASNGDV